MPDLRATYIEIDPDGRMTVVASSGTAGLPPIPPHTLDISALPSYVELLRAGEPIVSEDGSRAAQFGGVFAEARIADVGAFADVPVSRAGRLVGLLSLDSAAPRRFLPGEVQSLTEIARQLAVVIEGERAETTLRRRDEILSTVSRAAAALVAGVRWEDAAPGLLEMIGGAVGASRAYIFETGRRPDGTLVASQCFEWCVPGVSPQLASPELQNLVFAEHGLEQLAEVVSSNQVFARNVRELEPAARSLLQSHNVLSIISVPIVVDGEWWGYIGFDDCAHEREWSPAETDALRAAASLIAAAIARERGEQALRENEQTLGAVFEAAPDGILITDDTGATSR